MLLSQHHLAKNVLIRVRVTFSRKIFSPTMLVTMVKALLAEVVDLLRHMVEAEAQSMSRVSQVQSWLMKPLFVITDSIIISPSSFSTIPGRNSLLCLLILSSLSFLLYNLCYLSFLQYNQLLILKILLLEHESYADSGATIMSPLTLNKWWNKFH